MSVDYLQLEDGSGRYQLESGTGDILLESSFFLPSGPGVMPNCVGLILQEALQYLQLANILVPAKIGYFGTYPITVVWIPATANRGVVVAQTIAYNTVNVAPNTPLTFTVNDFLPSVIFP